MTISLRINSFTPSVTYPSEHHIRRLTPGTGTGNGEDVVCWFGIIVRSGMGVPEVVTLSGLEGEVVTE